VERGLPGPPRRRAGSDADNGIAVLDNREVRTSIELVWGFLESFALVDES
jgi:hypothetical protein